MLLEASHLTLPRASIALLAADPALADSLTEEELDMTVEEYLKKQCERRVEQLKRHMEGLVENFDGEAKKARTVLRDVAANASGSTEDDSAAAASSAAAGTAASSSMPSEGAEAFGLVCIRGMFTGRVYRFQPNEVQNKWSIGRTDDNDVSLNGDDEASSKHAQISFVAKDKQFKLMDVGSTNGTFVSDKLVQAAKLKKKKNHVLKVDHLVTFGSCTFKWCFHADAQALAESLAKVQKSNK